jgi:hypothetical protein
VEVDRADKRERRRGGGGPDAVAVVALAVTAPAEGGGSPDAVAAMALAVAAPAEGGGGGGSLRGRSGGLSSHRSRRECPRVRAGGAHGRAV